jgi:hypothetical protein
MLLTKLKFASAVIVLVGLLTAGIGGLFYTTIATAQPQNPQEVQLNQKMAETLRAQDNRQPEKPVTENRTAVFKFPGAIEDNKQPEKTPKEKLPVTSRTVLADLQTEVKTDNLDETDLSGLLRQLRDVLEKSGKSVTFNVDQEAYCEDSAGAPVMLDLPIHLRNLPPKASMQYVLRQALKQLPIKSTFVVRAGNVHIVPFTRTTKEYMLNQTFHVEFSERRLDQALEELSDLTGVSIVIDTRAKQKAQTAVTARFHDDVALQDAVRMLSDMAELKIVYLVTGMYITTPEHAPVMQKELQKAYGIPESRPAATPQLPLMDGAPIDPLMPPLPPNRLKREAGAA